jgi:hypothetical protein
LFLVFYDFCCQLFVEQCGVHGEKFVVGTVFDGAFAMAMDKDGTLLSLLGSVAADVDEGFDDIVEGVDIIVVEHHTAAVVFHHGGLVFGLLAYIWFVLFQF